jgi:hypothetical protein
MNVKRMLVGAAVAAAFFNSGVAFAGPLASVVGAVEFKLSGVTSGFFTQLDTNEVTWGVGNITQITSPTALGATSVWNSGEGGDFLGYVLYGIADLSSSGTSPNLNLYNNGAVDGAAAGSGCGLLCGSIYIDMFRRTTAPTVTTPSARTAYNGYTGVSDAFPLWLRLQLTPGIVADDPATGPNEQTTATLSQTLTSLTLPSTGGGTFFANVVGGSALASYNTNGFTTLTGSSADMYGIFDLRDNTTGPSATCSALSTNCFFGLIRDPVSANAVPVPEPGSIALLGLGLLAMGGAGVRRQRMAQAQD